MPEVCALQPLMLPALTVLMSAHNAGPFVGAAVDSILSQTLEDFEFVVIDDCSTDDTLDVLRSYRDPRIRLLRNAQKVGLARSLNRGLRSARGALIARQDADDISEPDRLRSQYDLLCAEPHLGMVGCGYQQIDGEGRPGATYILPVDDLEIRWAMQFHCPFVHTGVVFRASIVPARVGFYDESFSYSMDFELWMRVATVTRMANVPRSLVRLRLHAASMTTTCGTSVLEGTRLRLVRLCHVLGLDPEIPLDASGVDGLMSRVSRGEPLEPGDIDALSRIHMAFSRREGLSEEAASTHWAALLKRWSTW